MEDVISLYSTVCLNELLSEIVDKISPETVNWVYTEETHKGVDEKYFMSLNARCFMCKEMIADCLSGWIIENFEKKIMCEILKINFSEVSIEDIFTIIKNTERKITDLTHAYHSNLIKKELHEYFLSNNSLNIDGFVRFRLANYRQNLEKLLYNEIDECLLKQECELFICLLQEYIDSREPIIELIHIKEEGDNSFTLLDFKHNNISTMCENEFIFESAENHLSNEDKLLGILLTLNPRRIIWHGYAENNHENLFKTIEKIFKKRFSLCEGCKICNKTYSN